MEYQRDNGEMGSNQQLNHPKLLNHDELVKRSLLKTFNPNPISTGEILAQFLLKYLIEDQGNSEVVSLGGKNYLIILGERYLNLLLNQFGKGRIDRFEGDLFTIVSLNIDSDPFYKFYFTIPKLSKSHIVGESVDNSMTELENYFKNKVGIQLSDFGIKGIVKIANKKNFA